MVSRLGSNQRIQQPTSTENIEETNQVTLNAKDTLLEQVGEQSDRKSSLAPSISPSQADLPASPSSMSLMQVMLGGNQEIEPPADGLDVSIPGHEITLSPLTIAEPKKPVHGIVLEEKQTTMTIDGKDFEVQMTDIPLGISGEGLQTQYSTNTVPYRNFDSLQELAETVLRKEYSDLAVETPTAPTVAPPADGLDVSVPGHEISLSALSMAEPAAPLYGVVLEEKQLTMTVDGKDFEVKMTDITKGISGDGLQTQYYSDSVPYRNFDSLQELAEVLATGSYS